MIPVSQQRACACLAFQKHFAYVKAGAERIGIGGRESGKV
jgi:hypothetical protein